jgi:hypothetical protein
MYQDPDDIRQHRIVIRVSNRNRAFVTALANYQGEAVATLAHDLMLHMAFELIEAYNVPILDGYTVKAKALKRHFAVPQNA